MNSFTLLITAKCKACKEIKNRLMPYVSITKTNKKFIDVDGVILNVSFFNEGKCFNLTAYAETEVEKDFVIELANFLTDGIEVEERVLNVGNDYQYI